jgi:hypothetical protein
MKTEFINIIFIIALQGQYDFNIWYGVAKEQSGIWWEWIYRVIKETVDLAVIPGILYFHFGWTADLLGAFYLAKWFGWADAVYIALGKLFTWGEPYVQGPIWWMWWTPLGLIRTISTREKGVISFAEFINQLIVGLVVSYAAYHFRLAEWILKILGWG